MTGEVETSSSPIRRQAPDAKYPNGMSAEKIPNEKHPGRMSTEQNSKCDTSWWNVRCHTLQGGRLRVQGVGIPPPDDTKHASLSGATPSGFLKRTYGGAPLSELPQGEAHGTDKMSEHHTRMVAYPIRMCCPDH